MKTVRLRVNGTLLELTVDCNETLLETLRERLQVTESKEGCLTGECGACTVLLDKRAVNSCLVLTCEADGCELETVKHLASPDGLHPLQRAFVEEAGVECGFCTPGFIMTAASFLKDNPKPTREEIRKGIAGNLCRCTGYGTIVEAIYQASRGKYGETR